jgi:spermidine synthase/MFS family permease
MRRRVVVASFIAFIVSFCIMVVELVAGRVMAPLVGSSLYTWTSIIGVVLAGISLGAYLGGVLADWFPRHFTLGVLIFLSGLATLSLIPVTDYVAASNAFGLGATGELPSTAGFIYRIVALTAIVFFLPATIMGMVSPVVVKLAVSNVSTSGNTIGRIYSFSTLGSILGTFFTGFYLVEAMGVRSILSTVGVILLYGAPLFCMLFDGLSDGRGSFSPPRLAAWILFILGSFWLAQAVMHWYFVAHNLGEADVRRVWEVFAKWEKEANDAHWTMIRDAALVAISFVLAGICWGLGGFVGRVVLRPPEGGRVAWPGTASNRPVDFGPPPRVNVADPLAAEPAALDEVAPDVARASAVVRYAGLINFVASFCILAMELIAGRLLAPSVGVSLYSWTSIIGVVLAGISLGAYLGGKLADLCPSWITVGVLFLIAGLAVATIPFMTDWSGDGKFMEEKADAHYGLTKFYGFDVPLMYRILAVTVLVFFVPSLIMGMISPVVNRLAVSSLQTTGATVGKIYAWSTAGSILGTFVTGFYLVEFMGTRTVAYSIAAVLVLLAPVFMGLFSEIRFARLCFSLGCVLLLVGALCVIGVYREPIGLPLRNATVEDSNGNPVKDSRGRPRKVWTQRDDSWDAKLNPTTGKIDWVQSEDSRRTLIYKESDYYTIKVWDQETLDHHTRTLYLDHLTHSYTDMRNPYHLKYQYLKIYEEVVAWWRTKQAGREDFLFIGGGGYTLPRCYVHQYPKARVDVVEIDPWVIKVAREYLGINQEPRITSYNQDGRWFVMNWKEQYDFIFGDAFNDLSIPYHLTTKEFNQHVKNRLKPGGMYMALVIDSIKDGELLPSYIRTLQEVFGTDHVTLIVLEKEDVDEIGQETCIVVASMDKLDWSDFEQFNDNRTDPDPKHGGVKYSPESHVVPHERLQRYLTDIKKRGRQPIVLTDNYVPADNLIAKLFKERFSFKKKQEE